MKKYMKPEIEFTKFESEETMTLASSNYNADLLKLSLTSDINSINF